VGAWALRSALGAQATPSSKQVASGEGGAWRVCLVPQTPQGMCGDETAMALAASR
jgi:hypothetical protein